MGLGRTSLVLYILFILHLQDNFPSVSSRASSVDRKHETLPFNASKPDVIGFAGKTRELAVVIKRRGGGGGGRTRSSGGGRVVPVHAGGGGTGGSHRSSGSRNLRVAGCAVGWLVLSVLAGLFLV
ncbi:hypothetical protein EUTSA_v10009119mg [Eutrema salsugineum]|uniref:Uncharacterized protein n=1 Tax=Eutrema salsugineum TaxID=72664 RepID=V4L1M5_EUTSA|nr:uncharacterized protein LOC18994158 [Eutrema salsugineum]ESQ36192.1 hypothetical protein EUTSA_v10009119mg [Eutrema salsugineum]